MKTVTKSLLFVSLTLGGAASPSFGAFITGDIFKYQLPNQPTYYKLYDENVPRQEIQGPVLTIAANTAGLRDTLIFFRSPTDPNGDPSPGNTIGRSDIVAMKVTPGQITLSLWSDNSLQTDVNFIAGLNLVNPRRVTVRETGNLQDINNTLFAGGASPFAQIAFASDPLTRAARRESSPFILTGPGSSDKVSLFKAGQPRTVVGFSDAKGGVESTMNLIPPVTLIGANVPLTDKLICFETPLNLTDGDPSGNQGCPGGTNIINAMATFLSDILVMKVTGDCTDKVIGCTLTFGYWSEDPKITGQAFVNAFFGAVKPAPLEFSELGHDDVTNSLFGGLSQSKRPFTRFFSKSDPPIPEPGTGVFIVTGLLGLAAYSAGAAHKRRLRR